MPDASRPPQQLRLAVVGGGVSGLSAGHRLQQLAPHAQVRLFEASDRLGGPLCTLNVGDSVLEQGADSFLTRSPSAIDLCRELGLADELVPTSLEHRRALVVRGGKLFPVPDGFVLMRPGNLRAVLKSPLLSVAGKIRLLAEPFIPAPSGAHRPNYDESLANFATRRLGRQAFERLVEPLMAGIYVADARRLSLAATMPEFLEAERTHGSLWRSRARGNDGDANAPDELQPRQAPESAARYGAFLTLRSGMSRLVRALADRLGENSIELNTPIVEAARVNNRRWLLKAAGGVEHGPFEGVIIATPATHAGRLIERVDPQLSHLLARIEYASSVVVTLLYERGQILGRLDGFGFVVPAIENRPIIAASFSSVKFPHCSPADRVPIRVFLGGALRPELVDRSDDELTAISRQQLEELLGARGVPLATHVARWPQSMPQYHVGHVELASAIEHRSTAHHGLELAGNAYRGVGIPQCIRGGRQAAERLITQVTGSDAAGEA